MGNHFMRYLFSQKYQLKTVPVVSGESVNIFRSFA